MKDVQWQRAMQDAQRSAEWFEQRKNRITGSRAGAIMGLNPNKTRDDVMREMVREHHGAESEFQGNIATRWGNDHEDEAVRALDYYTGSKVVEAGIFARGWFGASPDGFIELKGQSFNVEVKCPFGIRNQEPPVFKGISAQEQAHYYAQIQLEMKAAGTSATVFWQWTPKGKEGKVVKRDHRFIARMMPILYQFYLELQEEIAKPDEHLAPKRAVVSTNEAFSLTTELAELQDSQDLINERIKAVKQRMIELAQDKSATVGGINVTKVESDGKVSWQKVAKAVMPDNFDVEKYRGKPSTTWRIG